MAGAASPRRTAGSALLCLLPSGDAGRTLIVIEVALTTTIPERIDVLLAEDRTVLPTSEATVACFYSISNCQRGLRGVSFGNFLIKQVASELATLYPGLATFVTLSPIPGLATWIKQHAVATDPEHPDPSTRRRAMLRFAARYLVEEKRTDGLPLDAVARFHLGNGARVEALRWEADGSERGMAQSYGTMVNYLYDLGAIEDNHEAFRQSGRVPASAAVTALLKDDRQEKAIKWPIRSTTP